MYPQLERFRHQIARDTPQFKLLATITIKQQCQLPFSKEQVKIHYRIDPANPYPRAFTGHLRATLTDGRVIEERQPHFRGGAQEPLSAAEIAAKYAANAAYGGWPAAQTDAARATLGRIFDVPLDLRDLRG